MLIKHFYDNNYGRLENLGLLSSATRERIFEYLGNTNIV